MSRKDDLIPDQKRGNYTGVEEALETSSYKEAVNLFFMARNRLFDINQWHVFTGYKPETFMHMNEKGELLERKPRRGDFIRIDLIGPGPRLGNNYDWMQIEAVEDVEDRYHDEDYCAIRVRPVRAPGLPANADKHNFNTEGTKTFIVHRQGKTITASEKGRNEVPNPSGVGWTDKVQNSVISIGSATGFSKLQWNTLLKGFLQKE